MDWYYVTDKRDPATTFTYAKSFLTHAGDPPGGPGARSARVAPIY